MRLVLNLFRILFPVPFIVSIWKQHEVNFLMYVYNMDTIQLGYLYHVSLWIHIINIVIGKINGCQSLEKKNRNESSKRIRKGMSQFW